VAEVCTYHKRLRPPNKVGIEIRRATVSLPGYARHAPRKATLELLNRARVVFHSSNRLAPRLPGKTALECESQASELGELRWAPDGQRFVFVVVVGAVDQVWVSNASGGRSFPIDPAADESAESNHSAGCSAPTRLRTQWPRAGEWILYPSVDGVSLASPDGKSRRTLTTRRFTAYRFSKSGEQRRKTLRHFDRPLALRYLDAGGFRSTEIPGSTGYCVVECFKPAIQFNTTVIGRAVSCSTGTGIRKRLPSAEGA
jgi:hypothetical protein